MWEVVWCVWAVYGVVVSVGLGWVWRVWGVVLFGGGGLGSWVVVCRWCVWCGGEMCLVVCVCC